MGSPTKCSGKSLRAAHTTTAAQFITVCSSSILAETRGYAISFSSRWRGKRCIFEQCKPVFMGQLQPSTNSDKLSDGVLGRRFALKWILCIAFTLLRAAENMRGKSALLYRVTRPLGHRLHIFLNSAYKQKITVSRFLPFPPPY